MKCECRYYVEKILPSDDMILLTGRIRGLLENNEEDENVMYARIDQLLLLYPEWRVTTPISRHVQPKFNWQHPVQALPRTEEERSILNENNGIGPIHVSLLVIKRLYEEEKAFKDLHVLLKQYIDDNSQADFIKPHELPTFRILYRLFPSLLVHCRIKLASESKIISRICFLWLTKKLFLSKGAL